MTTRVAFDPTIPFTWAEAVAAGITSRELRGPRYIRIFHDRYVASSVEPTARLRASVALSLCRGTDGHASHSTAAEIWGGWIPDDADTHVSVRRRSDRPQVRGVKAHLAHADAAVTMTGDLRVSTPAQSFLDMARSLSLVDLVVLGDSLVRREWVAPEDLIIAADRWRGHGAVLARRAARLVRAGVESPMETRLRLLIVLAGLPEPTINLTIAGPSSRPRLRLDLSYPFLRLAIEYDGRRHAESDEQWQHDITRRESLDQLGWRLIVVTYRGLFHDPEGTLSRIVLALADRRGYQSSTVPDDEWRRHFPGRRTAA